MECASKTYSACDGEVVRRKLIPDFILDKLASKGPPDEYPFNMEAIRKVAGEEIDLCFKHNDQHMGILLTLIEGEDAILLTKEEIEMSWRK